MNPDPHVQAITKKLSAMMRNYEQSMSSWQKVVHEWSQPDQEQPSVEEVSDMILMVNSGQALQSDMTKIHMQCLRKEWMQTLDKIDELKKRALDSMHKMNQMIKHLKHEEIDIKR
jgi:CRISPR/Cas system-associated endonuclease/helicase Cas3